VAATDIVTPVLAGLILGESLYGAWIAVVLTVAVLGGVLARGRLRPHAAG
jgi:DHA1 family tetracycline resistance protein-like MFS transporter